MARYLQVAEEANKVAKELHKLALTDRDPEGDVDEAALEFRTAELIAMLVNYGLRCSPRAVQSTVRLRAVQTAVKGLPCNVDMVKMTSDDGERSYNALRITPKEVDRG